MTGVLSLKTVVPKPRGRVWYHDQSGPGLTIKGGDLSYAFTGQNPQNVRNLWLRDAMERQLPLIYFVGVAPGVYEPIFPVFVISWDAYNLRCALSVSAPSFAFGFGIEEAVPERRYALRTVQQRLHQSIFRERVLEAYGRRCALSNLPEPRLIDAAHIVPDQDQTLGQPDVRNGICMSKIHHAAYDSGLIGIDPDLRIHVAPGLMEMHDGPMLEQGLKALAGRLIRPPDDPRVAPDPDRLAFRFELFRAAS
jgi:putative restriction endonuclease